MSELLVDTSVAVALIITGHESHQATLRALEGRHLGLAGHAWFETYSVLTRLPAPARRTAVEVHRILERNFPGSRYLSGAQTKDLVKRLSSLGIAGGAVYDALVGTVAAAHGLPLASRDIRAGELYRSLGVTVELLT